MIQDQDHGTVVESVLINLLLQILLWDLQATNLRLPLPHL